MHDDQSRTTTTTTTTGTDTVSRLLEQYAAGAGVTPELFHPAATLDATVPNWRMGAAGAEQVAAMLSGWFADPGTYEEQRRIPVGPDCEIVELTLSWLEDGVPHTCHQTHHVDLLDGRIVGMRTWCGGRWPASLLAEMEAANMEGA